MRFRRLRKQRAATDKVETQLDKACEQVDAESAKLLAAVQSIKPKRKAG